MYILDDILKQSVSAGASDIHFSVGRPPYYRIDGVLSPAGEEPLMPRELSDLLLGILDEAHRQELGQTGQTDLAYAISGVGRFRVNIFRQRGTYAAAMRCLPFTIPDADSLHIPPQVQGLTEKRRGLVLVTWPTGSGKSTTLASLVDIINRNYPYHIITLEDPIEYIYEPDQCIINQREIGKDTRSYADGLRSILREDPDVILIGEMRDLNTIETALTAAETGHLVFATLHTNSAADSVDRMVNVFPEGQQRQIRLQLSTTLRAVLSQQLLPKRAGGRAAACEVMMVNSAIKNLIREGKTPQIDSFITMNAQDGSITMDNALLKMVREGTVTYETALGYARDREAFSKGRRG